MLILDEPTAALDAQAEYELYQRFRQLMRERTCLLITHRFSPVRMADSIAVLEHGQITEYGMHAELLARQGTYAKLNSMQAESYTETCSPRMRSEALPVGNEALRKRGDLLDQGGNR